MAAWLGAVPAQSRALLVLVDNRCLRWPLSAERARLPRWQLRALRTLLLSPYLFGFFAKLNPSWLLDAEPVRSYFLLLTPYFLLRTSYFLLLRCARGRTRCSETWMRPQLARSAACSTATSPPPSTCWLSLLVPSLLAVY